MSINNSPFIPTTLEVNSLGIGFSSYSNLYNLDLKYDEYLVVGERENSSTNSLDRRYNMIVNNQGVAINTSRSKFNSNNNLYNAGLYVDNNIVCSGNIIAKGLQFDNITLGENLNAETLTELIKTINDKQDILYRSSYKTNIIGTDGSTVSKVDNIYLPSYLTLGGDSVTANNKHILNIVETPNNTIENIQVSIRNSSTSEDLTEINGGKMRMGIIGGNNISPSIITTTENMPLEFHVGAKSSDINKLYESGEAFPDYVNNPLLIPSMTIDSRKNIGIGTTSTSFYDFTKYRRTQNSIINYNISEYAKIEVKGIAAIENLLLYDYFTNSYKHLDDLYIRASGYSLDATQIREGIFYGDYYEFFNNVKINNNLQVGNIDIDENLYSKNISTCNITINNAIFNESAIFLASANLDINSKLTVNNELHLTDANNLFINDKRINILDIEPIYLDPSILSTYNITNTPNAENSILFFASQGVIDFSGSNLVVPEKLGVGIQQGDSMSEQFNIVKRESEKFEIAIHDHTDEDETSSAYFGHLINYIDNDPRSIDRDNSLIINTNKTASRYNNIYFMPGIDISNRSSRNLDDNITLAINQNKKVGINTIRPLYELDVNGTIITNDMYIRKNNTSIYKSNNFSYNIANNSKIYNLYDKDVTTYCVNYLEFNINNNPNLKTFNVNGSINASLYYENNVSIESLKNKPDASGIYTNKNVSIGWLNESSVVPLQVRNMAITNNNNSILRFYRGKKGGGFFNDASYSGVDICDFESLPGTDKNNFKWYMYKHHLDVVGTNNEILVGPLQFGYTDNSITPDINNKKGLIMYYNNSDKSYHIDINAKETIYQYNKNAAMSIYGDLEVYGNINIIDTNNCNYTYKINGIQYSSNAINNFINQLPSVTDNNQNDGTITNNTDKNDIIINAEKITIIPNKTTLIGYTDSWFLNYANKLQDQPNIKTPLIVYQKNVNYPITRFAANGIENNATASIELGTYNITNNNNGDIKNMVQFNVCGYENNTILNIGSYNKVYDNTFVPFISFYHKQINSSSSCYTHIGGSKYPTYDVVSGALTVDDVCVHIEDDSKYSLQITSHEKSPMINLHKKNGVKSVYYIINGGDDNNNFTINAAVSSNNTYSPENITSVFTISGIDDNGEIREGARVGFNKQTPVTTIDVNGIVNEPCTQITNNYNEIRLENNTDDITIVNKHLYFIPNDIYKQNNTYYFGLKYKIDPENIPSIDNNNKTIVDNYKNSPNFIATRNITFDNFVNYKVNYNFTTSYETSDISLKLLSSNTTTNKVSSNIIVNNDIFYEINPNLISSNIENTIYIPEDLKINYQQIETFSLDTDDAERFENTVFSSNYNINYSYNNNYLGPLYINSNYAQYYNLFNTKFLINSDIDNNIDINVDNLANIYLYNSNLCDASNVLVTNTKNIIGDDGIYKNIYVNTNTSNIIHYYSKNVINDVKFEILRDNNIYLNTNINAPIKIIDDNNSISISSDISLVNNVSNVNIYKNVDFLNERPDGLNVVNSLLTSNITSNATISKYNIIDDFTEFGITFPCKINIFDNYKVYVPDDNKYYIGINYLRYEPHIVLDNIIDFSDAGIVPKDNIHKIYSHDGDFKINIFSDNEENNIFNLSKYGDATFKNSIITENIYIQNKIYDKLGNDLVNIINNFNTSNILYYQDIRACNYRVQSCNMEFAPTGVKGFVINNLQNDFNDNYNIFTVYDNDTINKYTRLNIQKEGIISINKAVGNYALDVNGTINSDDNVISPNLVIDGGDGGFTSINTPIYSSNFIDINNSNYATTLNINHHNEHIDIVSINEDDKPIFNIRKNGKIGINKLADETFDLDVNGSIRISDTIYSSNLIVYGDTVELTTVQYKTENLVVYTEAIDGPGLTIYQNGTESILELYNKVDADNNLVMTVFNNGNLGIGIDYETEFNLHVKDDVKFNNNLFVDRSISIGDLDDGITTNHKLEVTGGSSLFNSNIGIGTVDNNYRLNVSYGDGKFCSNLFIDNNVGIGTTATVNRLEVTGGEVLFNSNLKVGSNVGIGIDYLPDSINKLYVNGNIITTAIGSIKSGSNLEVAKNVSFGGPITDYRLFVNDGDSKFSSNVFIGNNVGIGTDATVNRLEVTGGDVLFNSNLKVGSNVGIGIDYLPDSINKLYVNGNIITTAIGSIKSGSNLEVAKNVAFGGPITDYRLFVNDGDSKFSSNVFIGNNIGIGTDATVNRLEVTGGSSLFNSNIGIGTVDNNYRLNVSYGDAKICSNLFIDNNVGIGTTATENRLEVTGGDVLFNSNLKVGSNVGIGIDYLPDSINKLYVNGNIITTAIGSIKSGSNLEVAKNVAFGGPITDYRLFVNDGDSKFSSNIFIGNNIGIGTDATVNRLEVTGGSSLFNSNIGIGTVDNNYRLNVSYGDAKICSNLFIDNNVGIGTTATENRLEVTGGDVLFNSNLKVGSNVGIGIDYLPDSINKLYVNGNIITTSIGSIKSGSNLEVAKNVAFGGPITDYRLFVNDGDSKFSSNVFIGNNVGIGTDATVNRLEVTGGSSLFNSNIGIGTVDNNYRLNVSYGDAKICSNLFIDNNVGIGTTATENRLEVTGGEVLFNSNLKVGSNVGIGIDYLPDSINKLYVNGNIITTDIGSIKSGSNLEVANNVAFGGPITDYRLFVNDGDSKFSSNVFIGNNVGIGTDSTENRLEVTGGDVLFNSNLKVGSNVGIGIDYLPDSINKLYVNGNIITTAIGSIKSGSNLEVANNVAFGGPITDYRLFVNDGDSKFSSNIFIGNNVGIGTDSTINRLEVTGGNALFNSNVGIGLVDNNYRLIVDGDVKFNSDFFIGKNLGIGTSSTNNRLQITGGNVLFNSNLKVDSNIGIGIDYLPDSINKLYVNGNIITTAIGSIKSGSNLEVANKVSFGGPITDYRLFVNDGDSKFSSNVFIGNNIGIGTNTTENRLEVTGGDVLFNSNLKVGSNVGIGIDYLPDSINKLYVNGNIITTDIGSIKSGSNLEVANNVAFGGPITDYRLFVNDGNSKFSSNVFIGNNVGIGTDATENRLEVTGGNALFNNNVGIGLVNDNYRFNVSYGDAKISSNLFIDNNVGIGTTATENRLEVTGGDVLFNSNLKVGSNVGIGIDYLPDSINKLYVNGNIITTAIGSIKSGSNLEVAKNVSFGGPITDYRLFVNDGDSKFSSNVFVGNNVGIGTDATENRLEVTGGNALFNNNVGIGLVDDNYRFNVSYGDAKISSNLFIDNNVGIGTTTTENRLEVTGGNVLFNSNFGIGLVDNNYRFNVSYGDAKISSNLFIDNNVGIGTTVTDNRLEVTGGDVLFNSNLKVGSNVGIGIDYLPDSINKLYVNGNIITTAIGSIKSGSNLEVANNVSFGGPITDYRLFVNNGDSKFSSNVFIGNNVGIGTDTTVNRLEVTGGNALFNSNVGIGLVDDNYKLNVSDGNVNINNNLFVDKIGINTILPSSRLTINDTITYCSNVSGLFNHSIAPLTVNGTNSVLKNVLNIPESVIHITRDGSDNDDAGLKASFNLSRFNTKSQTTNNNNTRLDISLANNNYDDVNIMTMLSNGKIGIGIAEPRATLHINGSIIVEDGLKLPFSKPEDLTSNSLMYVDSTGNIRSDQYISIISETKRIGVGIINPTCSLDIAGDIKNTGSLSIGDNLTIQSNLNANGSLNSFQNDVVVYGKLTTSNLVVNGETTILNTSLYQTEQLQVVSSSLGPALYVKQNGLYNIMELYDDETLAFTVINGGNVGIGKTNPAYNLDVNGTINSDYFKGDGSLLYNLTISESYATSNAVLGIVSNLNYQPYLTAGTGLIIDRNTNTISTDGISEQDILDLGFATSNAVLGIVSNLNYQPYLTAGTGLIIDRNTNTITTNGISEQDILDLGFTTSNAVLGIVSNLNYQPYLTAGTGLLIDRNTNTISTDGISEQDILDLGFTTSNAVLGIVSNINYQPYLTAGTGLLIDRNTNTISTDGISEQDILDLGFTTSNAVENIIESYNFGTGSGGGSSSIFYEVTNINSSYSIDLVSYKDKIGSSAFMKSFDITIISTTNNLLFSSTIYRNYDSSKISLPTIFYTTMFSFYSLNTIVTSDNQINFNNFAIISFSFTGNIEYININIGSTCLVTIVSK